MHYAEYNAAHFQIHWSKIYILKFTQISTFYLLFYWYLTDTNWYILETNSICTIS